MLPEEPFTPASGISIRNIPDPIALIEEKNVPHSEHSAEHDAAEILAQRIRAIRQGVVTLHDAWRAASGAEKGVALMAEYFLKSILRTPERPLSEVIGVLGTKTVGLPSDSLVRTAILSVRRDLSQVGVKSTVSSQSLVGEVDVKPLSEVMKEEGLTNDTRRLVLPRSAVTEEFSSAEERSRAIQERENVLQKEAVESLQIQWKNHFTRSQQVAQSEFYTATTTPDLLETYREVLQQELEGFRESWEMDPECIQIDYSDEFFAQYLVARQKAGEDLLRLDSDIRGISILRNRIAEIQKPKKEKPIHVEIPQLVMPRSIDVTPAYGYDEDEPTRPGTSVPGDTSGPRVIKIENRPQPIVKAPTPEKIAVIPESPEEILHIRFDLILREIEAIDILGDANIIRTKRRDIEKRIHDATAEALAALKYEDGENNDRVLKIQSAQQKLLHRVDVMLKDKERVADVDLALGGKREKPSEIDPGIRAAVEAERRETFRKKIEIMKTSLPDRAFNSVASAAHVVALALGLTAAGAALYELGENESDQPRAVVALDDGAVLAAPTHESAGIHVAEGVDGDQDLDQDLNTPGPLPAAALEATTTYEAPLTDTYVVKPGDEVRKIVMGLIREEGLKPTHEKVNTLSHIAMEVNGIPGDGSSLAIGTVLDLHNVREILDEMAGKPKAAEAAASSVPVSPDYAWTAQGSSLSPMFENGLESVSYGQYAGKLYAPYVPDEVLSSPKTEKAYGDIPTLEHPEHALKKGEYPFKIIHLMLLESGGNWSSKLMGDLVTETLEENGITEEEARRLPIGRVLTFKRAAWYLSERSKDRDAGKKMRTIPVLKEQMRAAGEL